MELSKRLYAVASLVTEGASVADVGTDHGYIPIYLIQEKIASRVIAMDINKGRLSGREYILKNRDCRIGLRQDCRMVHRHLFREKQIRLSPLGMGGGLVIHILEDGKDVINQAVSTKAVRE